MTQSNAFTIAIIGGGTSGAAVALHLALKRVAARIVIFEPRARLGGGLAYDTADPVHRINVPAARMSLFPDDPRHFLRWLEANGRIADDPAALVGGDCYARRSDFGAYVADSLARLPPAGAIDHRRDRVAKVVRTGGRWQIETAAGITVPADIVVIATTHPVPALPFELRPHLGHERLIPDSLRPGALARIGHDDRVLIVGSGLTAIDALASLEARGHRGPVRLISRRGLLPRGHVAGAIEPFGDFVTPPPGTALAILTATRRTIAEAARRGIPWQAVVDALRAQGQTIWRALPLRERRRLVRHLRPFWDVHRFRISPQMEAMLSRRLASGTTHGAARLGRVVADGTGFAVTLHERASGQVTQLAADWIIVTTGPDHGRILATEPYLTSLARQRLLAPDPSGLGIATGIDARALDAEGHPVATLFIAGPLARGTVGELMGLPQVTDYALFVAGRVCEQRALQSGAQAGGASGIDSAPPGLTRIA